MFCAAIPAAAATGAAINNQQVRRRTEAQSSGGEIAPDKPVLKLTAGAIVLLVIGSITYHSLTFGL